MWSARTRIAALVVVAVLFGAYGGGWVYCFVVDHGHGHVEKADLLGCVDARQAHMDPWTETPTMHAIDDHHAPCLDVIVSTVWIHSRFEISFDVFSWGPVLQATSIALPWHPSNLPLSAARNDLAASPLRHRNAILRI